MPLPVTDPPPARLAGDLAEDQLRPGEARLRCDTGR